MKRNLFWGGILVLVAFFVWSAASAPVSPRSAPAATEPPAPPTLCVTCAQGTQVAAMQAEIDLKVQQAQSMATAITTALAQAALEPSATPAASGFWAQGAVTTPYPWAANALATANAADMTQNAVQAETSRQRTGLQLPTPMASEVPAIVALTGLQAQTDLIERPEPGTVLWMWLTPILILAAAVLTLWGVTRWLNQRQTKTRPSARR